jgi:hypothetical protein
MRVTAQERMSDFTAGPGGVMTDEVGVVTGGLALKTTVDSDNEVVQLVQYQQAAQLRPVSGALTRVAEEQSIDTVQATMVGALAARPKLTVRTIGFDEPAVRTGLCGLRRPAGASVPLALSWDLALQQGANL